MFYILNTPQQIKEMLDFIGVSSVEELYESVPSEARIKGELNLDEAKSEYELRRIFRSLSERNKSVEKFNSFLGAGIYDHYIPAALEKIVSRSEFYTPYTPYQAEASQGILQVIYEYQTYICLLTGMDISNASMYDGASSLCEAVLMGFRISKKTKILVSQTVHPEYRETLKTYLRFKNIMYEEIAYTPEGIVDIELLKKSIDDNTGIVVFQNPNFFGCIEEVEDIARLCQTNSLISIAVVNPFSLALLKPPGDYGIDIVCGDAQGLGGRMNLGGPTLGFLASKKEFLRQMPGRIVGRTTDVENNEAFCLTLQTREQHIRREKATSNICSNHSLNAITVAVYLSLLGKENFYKFSWYSLNNAHYLRDNMSKIAGIEFPFSRYFFNEFVWKVKNASEVYSKLREKGILCGILLERFYPELKDCILSCCTEKKTKEDIDSFISVLKEIL